MHLSSECKMMYLYHFSRSSQCSNSAVERSNTLMGPGNFWNVGASMCFNQSASQIINSVWNTPPPQCQNQCGCNDFLVLSWSDNPTVTSTLHGGCPGVHRWIRRQNLNSIICVIFFPCTQLTATPWIQRETVWMVSLYLHQRLIASCSSLLWLAFHPPLAVASWKIGWPTAMSPS